MEYKPGIKTSEFSLTAVFSAVGGLLVYYGLAKTEEVQLWIVLLGALMTAIPPVVYTIARTWYKARGEFAENVKIGIEAPNVGEAFDELCKLTKDEDLLRDEPDQDRPTQ